MNPEAQHMPLRSLNHREKGKRSWPNENTVWWRLFETPASGFTRPMKFPEMGTITFTAMMPVKGSFIGQPCRRGLRPCTSLPSSRAQVFPLAAGMPSKEDGFGPHVLDWFPDAHPPQHRLAQAAYAQENGSGRWASTPRRYRRSSRLKRDPNKCLV